MTEGVPSADALRRQLLAQGFPLPVVNQMIQAATAGSAIEGSVEPLELESTVLEGAEEQALTIALAFSESRVTLADLVTRSTNLASERRYRDLYQGSIEKAGLARVELTERFPVLSGHFGFTRGSPEPGASYLSAFREARGDYVVYGDIAETEALFFGLAPLKVASWLSGRGYELEPFSDEHSARISVLRAAGNVNEAGNSPILDEVTKLVHTYAHRMIRLGAVHAGIERTALSELLIPMHLGFFVYAAARGDFVLGGLQAVFESYLDRLLHEFVFGERRCALDPGCSRGGGACVACLHLGEPSCRLFNRQLNRAVLTGDNGYLRFSRVV